jgi:type II restriction enzyme
LVAAGLVKKSAANPSANTNDPSRGYAVSVDAGPLLRLYGTPHWPDAAAAFVANAGNLTDRINRQRKLAMVVATLPDGRALELSPGPHNKIQQAIIEQFLPRFVPGAEVLYVGDTSKKVLVLESEKLKKLGFFELSHDLLPDVVAYDKARNWLILIEAVHSSNPMSPIRHLALEEMTERCTAPRVYVSAFETRKSLSRWLHEISWETEVWVMDSPDHMIHFNGVRFLGPYPDPNEQVQRG